jgi:hypothetical protein
MHLEVEHLGRLQPGVAHVVGIADPGHGLALDAAAMLDVGVDVGQDLARVVFVGQAVDHRHARIGGKALDDFLLEGADHHDVAHPRNHLRRILDRLAAPELRIAGIQVDRRTAELVHAGLERQPRARAGLLEDHHQRAVGQRPVLLVGLELVLDPARALEDVVELVAREILELQKMFDRHDLGRQEIP